MWKSGANSSASSCSHSFINCRLITFHSSSSRFKTITISSIILVGANEPAFNFLFPAIMMQYYQKKSALCLRHHTFSPPKRGACGWQTSCSACEAKMGVTIEADLKRGVVTTGDGPRWPRWRKSSWGHWTAAVWHLHSVCYRPEEATLLRDHLPNQ